MNPRPSPTSSPAPSATATAALCCLAIAVAAHAPAAEITFVSFHAAVDAPSGSAAGAGFTEAPDRGYTDLLEADGHNVTRTVSKNDLTADDIATLNAAELIIISRSVASNHYQEEAGDWNTMITAPVINLGGYTLRNSRLNFTDGGTMVDANSTISLAVAEPAHPVFLGIPLNPDPPASMTNAYAQIVALPFDPAATQRGISVNNNTVVGGRVLATVHTSTDPTFGAFIVAEWETGATLNNGDVLAGPRLVLLTGSREQGVSAHGAGIFDLVGDGPQIFRNAVNYYVDPPDLTDRDGDGVPDVVDAFPDDPNEWIDTDGDGVGNNADLDDDGDDVPDTEDALPLDETETMDFDRDGIGDNADLDDDGDRVPDTEDVFPFDPTEWADSDGDGIGDNADPDTGGGPENEVVWVSIADSPAGQEFIDLLADAGYAVTEYIGTSATLAANPDDIPLVLNAADVVVVSRKINSGEYNSDEWDDDITVPLICNTPYTPRNNRWGWFDANGLADATPEAVRAEVPEHPLFAGIDLDADNLSGPWHFALDRETSLNTDPVVNGGTLLASYDHDGDDLTAPYVVAAEWPAGAVAAGPRLLLAAGSRELGGEGAGIDTAGRYNMTENGAVALLNAVGIYARGDDPNLFLIGDGDFGVVQADAGPQTVDIVVRNTGATLDLTLTSVRLEPAGGPFSLVGPPATVPPATRAVFQVAVDPAQVDGQASATLVIETDDPGQPSAQIALSASVPLSPDLVAHYRFDEADGIDVIDSSGNGRHGILVPNTGAATPGQPGIAAGGGLALSGGALARVEDFPDLGTYTLSLWLNRNSSAGSVANIVAKGAAPTFALVTIDAAAENTLAWLALDNLNETQINVPGAFALGEDVHLALTHDDTNGPDLGGGVTRLYINGALAAEQLDAHSFADAVEPLEVGARLDGDNPLDAVVDDLQVYRRPLTAAEVAGLFNDPGSIVGGGPPPPPDSDGDGIPDAEEIALGLDPNDGSSIFVAAPAPGATAAAFSFTFPSGTGRTYAVEYKDALTDPEWTLLATVEGEAGATTFTDPRLAPPGATGFYRVRFLALTPGLP